ncbi:hypothetical protein E2C01_019381 [Portunus trituberculatus]|uniref:Uncharacterized protein n=1 Tax=Portunus trituberculatus TaxID=210409 RepID=A0A5B7DZ72_PORTR|nr:hypothetical protein [Portunus trituberculatus]
MSQMVRSSFSESFLAPIKAPASSNPSIISSLLSMVKISTLPLAAARWRGNSLAQLSSFQGSAPDSNNTFTTELLLACTA